MPGVGFDAGHGCGDGYKYLLRTVASADGERALSTPLIRYYAEQGTPSGRCTRRPWR